MGIINLPDERAETEAPDKGGYVTCPRHAPQAGPPDP
jgi:hypothetical protein